MEGKEIPLEMEISLNKDMCEKVCVSGDLSTLLRGVVLLVY